MAKSSIQPPVRVYLDLTDVCPLDCLHCYAAQPRGDDGDELSLVELDHLFQEIAAFGVSSVVISGGEPFVRDDLCDVLSMCVDKGLEASIITSGLLVSPTTARVLKELDVGVRVSLDGIHSNTHEYVRGKGNFNKALKAVKLLKEVGLERLSVHFTVNRQNIPEIVQIPHFLKGIGIREVVISTIKPTGRAREHPELLIEPSLARLVKERIHTIARSPYLRIRTYHDKTWSGLGCPAAHTKCGITSGGRLTPCVFLGNEYEGGSTRDHSFAHLWQHDRQLMQLRNILINPSCGACAALADYNGGCRARALHYFRHIREPDPYCCEMKVGRDMLNELVGTEQT